jgi:hypothetical protein
LKPPGCEVTYAIAGGNIVNIDRNSLHVSTIIGENGNNLRMQVNGPDGIVYAPVCHETRNNDGGKNATFSVFVRTLLPMTLVKFTGTINVLTADKTETKTLAFKNEDKGVEQTAGPLSFAIKDDVGDDGLAKMTGSNFAFVMKGDNNLVKEMTLTANGREVRNRAIAGDQEKATYYYDFPTVPAEFTLTVTYYTDAKEVSVRFGGQPRQDMRDQGW